MVMTVDYKGKTTVKNIFLTGATGVLGARLLMEILKSTDANVYCLSRDENHVQALERIKDLLFVYDPSRELEEQLWRIIPVSGDVSQENLGLEDSVYAELADSMDLLFHCAASVNLISSYEKIAPVNYVGTQNIIDFCLAGNIPLLFASSFSMIGDKLNEDGFTMYENQLDVGQEFEELNYERSKFESERLIHEESSNGLSWAIVRPGNIWGDSETGCYPLEETTVKGIYYDIVKTLVDTGYNYNSTEDFDITPVDYVAKASLHIALNIHKTNGKTYHLTTPDPITNNQFVQLLRDYGYTVRELSDDDYFGAIYEERMVKDGRPYQSSFINMLAIVIDDDLEEEKAKFDTSQIRDLLAGTDICCHETNGELFKKYLDYAVEKELIPSPQNQYPLAEISDEVENKIFMSHLYDAEDDLLMQG